MTVKETCRKIKMCTFHLLVDASMIHFIHGFWTIKPVKLWVYYFVVHSKLSLHKLCVPMYISVMHALWLVTEDWTAFCLKYLNELGNSFLLFAETLVWIVEWLYFNYCMLSFDIFVVNIVILFSKSFFLFSVLKGKIRWCSYFTCWTKIVILLGYYLTSCFRIIVIIVGFLSSAYNVSIVDG